MTRLPGEHAPNAKNRSSKHLRMLTKIRPIVRCVNGETLTSWANNGNPYAKKEIQRRANLKKNKQEQ